ncbi:hydratase [Natronospirillum operosum]|uniref:Hydratase n=1 Tax=Natronospirillum operosum TaxID=2759953 RepID=A0A4Z0WC82_9GAMM|nr:MaoC/PaaZ C-terminal domain-containing protein [Natronospirillum operosum]TGG92409.1 hydratase [Natronospirillum operosum]
MTSVDRADPIVEQFELSQSDFDAFADLSGDANPIHIDPDFAADTVFGATVSHGMLLFSRLRGALERHYPGCRLIGQELVFRHPAYADSPLRLVLTPRAVPPGEPLLTLGAEIIRDDGQPCLEGDCRLVRQRLASPVQTGEEVRS